MAKLLIVEDESIVALELESRLTDLGYSVCGIVASGEDAINLAIAEKPNIILMDINIKGPIDGVVTAEKIKEIIDIPIIFLTAFTDSNTLQRAKITEPYGYIVKPF
jgi:two-component system, response regulator PdtaR